MSSRFPPASRIRTRPEFTAVQNHGRRIATRFMTVLAQPSGAPRDRLGIVASRRLGGAVVRNRAKRRLREIFRRQAGEPPAASGREHPRPLDLVVIPRRELLDAPFLAVFADFQAAVGRLRDRQGEQGGRRATNRGASRRAERPRPGN